MGADEDVDFASFGFLQNFFLLLRIAEAADHFDGDGEWSKALLESFEVLEGEDGGGGEHGYLFVVADGFEGGTHGNFGFAVAHIAAEQAVHGLGGFHVVDDVFDGLTLIFGLVEFKSVFELAEPLVAGREGVSDSGFALGVELEEFVGHVFHGFADARFRLAPGGGAEMTQGGLRAFGRAILLHQVETGERNVEASGFGEFEQHEFGGTVAVVNFF